MSPNIRNITPYVTETTNYGERSIDVFTRLLKERIIFVGTPIDDLRRSDRTPPIGLRTEAGVSLRPA